MKKRRYVILLILAVFILSLRQPFIGHGSSPARVSHAIFVLTEGEYVGFSDTPVSAEEAARGKEVLSLLRSQWYFLIPLWPGPKDGGIGIQGADGCTPYSLAYWDGTLLWIPGVITGIWHSYLPLFSSSLGEKLDTYCN